MMMMMMCFKRRIILSERIRATSMVVNMLAWFVIRKLDMTSRPTAAAATLLLALDPPCICGYRS